MPKVKVADFILARVPVDVQVFCASLSGKVKINDWNDA